MIRSHDSHEVGKSYWKNILLELEGPPTCMLAPWGLVCLAFFGFSSHLLIFQSIPNLGTVLVGEKDEYWVLPRHTLRSRPVNPKPGCRASAPC